MVFQNIRNLNSFTIENEEIGPGKYEINLNTGNSLKQNMTPFNISNERKLHLENDNPGPGSYFQNEFNKGIKTTKEKISNQFPMYNFMMLLNNKKKRNFNELKIDKTNKSQVQSLNNLIYINNEEKKKFGHIEIIKRIKKNENIIPNLTLEKIKESISTPNSNMKKINNKKKRLLYKYINQSKIDNKDKTTSNYSTAISDNYKSKQLTLSDENSKVLKTNNSSVKNTNINKEGKKQFRLLPKIKRKSFKFFPKMKRWNKIMNNFEENILINKLRNKFEIDNFVSHSNFFDNTPGPGYYSTRSYFDKYQILSKKKNKNDLSPNNQNNMIKKKEIESKMVIEPYIKIENYSKNKTFLHHLSNTKKALRESISSNNLIKKLLNLYKNESILQLNNTSTNYKNRTQLNLGPGQYNIKSQFEQNNTKRYSFPLQKRFEEINKKTTPGPGSYISLQNWKKDKKEISEHYVINLNLSELKDNNRSPDMCTYNPHYINSIEYKNFVNNNSLNVKVPFGSSEKKLINKVEQTKEIIGPGTYFNTFTDFKDKNDKKTIRNYFTSEKFKVRKEIIKYFYRHNSQLLKDNIGPGSYINENSIYNNWSKKTFNIKFI